MQTSHGKLRASVAVTIIGGLLLAVVGLTFISPESVPSVAPVALAADELSVARDEAAPQHRRDRPTGHFQAFVRRVIGAMMQVRLRHGRGSRRVPDGDVGIIADGD